MITWNKVQKLAEKDPWLIEAIERVRHHEDKRPLQRRVKESIAFIAFRPFGEANPDWKGEGGFHPFFKVFHLGGNGDGVLYKTHPTVVFHYVQRTGYHESGYMFSELMPLCQTTVEETMRWYIQRAERDGQTILFDAIVKPLLTVTKPHRMIAECYDIYKFPEGFCFENWIARDRKGKETRRDYV